MTDFLLELRSEEIPARMQAKAREDLQKLFVAELGKAGIAAPRIATYATPRRLTLIAHDLPEATKPVREEVKGPRASAPPQALEGFLRKTGLTREALTERDGVLFAVTEVPGRETATVLATAIPAIVRAFPWPKSMRWGAASLSPESPRWVRPLQGIVALFGDAVVPCEVAGVTSGAETMGHRFHHDGPVTITSADSYVETLRDAHVIVDQNERAAIIAVGAKMAAQGAGLVLVEDEGLLAENAGLTEWPVPLLGRFDEAFLAVPPEVIQLTARVNQKYFVCRDGAGQLANAFVCTANIDAADGGERIVAGNAKVLAARLSDAQHFWEEDQWNHEGLGTERRRTTRKRLDDQLPKLEKIVFHEKLGTVADKVDRVAKLARWLVESGVVKNADPAHAERAARLAKADLVTGMVGEFPELQGLMGGYYAASQGEPVEVAEAVRDHYKPVGQGDDVPNAPVTVAVALADKLDTLVGFFLANEMPSGSRDPFALRRAALGVLRLITSNHLRLTLAEVFVISMTLNAQAVFRSDNPSLVRRQKVRFAIDAFFEKRHNALVRQKLFELGIENLIEATERTKNTLPDFFADRLKVQQREAGVRHDLIDAVFALGGEDDLVRLLARVHALQAFVTTEDGANLLAGYKRAANILKKEAPGTSRHIAETGEEDPLSMVEDPDFAPVVAELARAEREANDYDREPAEAALIAALDAAEPQAEQAIAAEDFAGAMAALATLRAPIDAFFTDVTVNDADPHKRTARLALLARVRDAVHRVADFSKIEG
ncbi:MULTISPECIES: glycine--tRNA ligase subunit beta [unclassified Sphingomonas]|uniref:glycine--tRNA ligase subunit beta n=1 Tax=unclassified Sphingomonas TaxID=196159 RepID=UPI0006FD0EBA|nr:MULTISPECIES: glycine--tRNA ligase subunit beta [unclassified Sphingomonas]KQM60030.1 glycine--tRNA ligase subunit beta [Sphingomonas sp. Leaf16]KQN11428.1 glycine--tRNA ligase subunit beta [Sphingomonas sp. Leaf29]KQN18749.1 glycine--tRNA ligase subunit beta [Sphingomonas sp. Leaf32]